MANFSLAAAAAALYTGQKMNADLAQEQAQTQLVQQQTADRKQDAQFKQQQAVQQQAQAAAMNKIITAYDTANQNAQVDAGTSPDAQKEQSITKEAGLYRTLGKTLVGSDPAKAESYFKLAETTSKQLADTQKTNLEIGEKRAKDTSAYAGAVLDGSVTPAQSFAWVRDNVSLKDAMSIPTDPTEARNWWKAKQTAGTSAEAQLANTRQVNEAAQRAQDRKDTLSETAQHHREEESARAIQLEQLRSSRSDAAEARADRLAAAAKDKSFVQSEKLNSTTATAAKPLVSDLGRVRDLQGLLKVDSSAADQQLRQGLVAFLGDFKGRATNQFYKDNKNFGDVVDKIQGFASRAFTGRYSENDREAITKLLNDMQHKTIEPALASLEAKQKAHAKGYGLDPDNIEIQAEFDRNAKAPASGRAAPAVGTVQSGYKFRGGDPSQQSNWEKQ